MRETADPSGRMRMGSLGTLQEAWPRNQRCHDRNAQTTQGNSNVHFLETVNCRSLAQGTPGMVDGFDTEIQCSGIRF